MSTRRRRGLFAVLALATVAGAGTVGLLALGEDLLAAARRRVPRGADREAVEAAVGRPADGMFGNPGRAAILFWVDGDDQLTVALDGDGLSREAEVHRGYKPTLPERFRAWLG
jgi:hypothetical protein